MAERHNNRRKKPLLKRIPMLLLSLITIVGIAICVLVFALLYNGGGVNALLDMQPATPVSGDGGIVPDTDPAAAGGRVEPSDSPAPDSLSPDALSPSPSPDAGSSAVPAANVSRAGRLIPYLENSLWGYKNTSGDIVIAARFTRAYEFDDDMAFASESGLFGLLSREGIWIAEPQWSDCLPFSEGRAAVESGDKWGFINESGELIIDYQFREVGSFSCGRALARSASQYGYIDVQGEYAVSANWARGCDFSEDTAFVTSESGNNYIINKIGDRLVTLSSKEKFAPYSESFALFSENGEYYYRNSSASIAFPDRYEDGLSFSSGLAAVKKGGLWGYINTRGVLSIPCAYSQAQSFSDGCAAVIDNTTGLWGYINKSGSYILNPIYNEATAFKDGTAIVKIGTEYSIADKSGKLTHLYYAP